jgi:predicted TIM-barrel fold metal-dependent hydrolase
MRIIDADTHISATAGPGVITIAELVEQMDRNGVERAVAWPMVSYTRQVQDDNRAIAKGMRKHPGRVIGFGGINPMLGVGDAMDELRRCIEEYGFKGFKLNGARDGYYIDDPSLAMPIFEEIAKAGLVVAIHCGINDPVHSHPWLIGRIAAALPELTIIMVHMGGAGSPGLYDAAIKIAMEYPNIAVAPSEADPKAIIRAIEELGPERVLYASDTPFSIMKVSLAVFMAILEDYPEDVRHRIMGGNAARLLGIHL